MAIDKEKLLRLQTAQEIRAELGKRPSQEAKYPGDWDRPTPLAHKLYPGFPAIAIFGDWRVSLRGEILNVTQNYLIENDQLDEDDWILHLTEKAWFTTESYEDFKRAYFVACKIKRVKQTHQIRKY